MVTITIKNKEIADGFRQQFEYLWGNCGECVERVPLIGR